MKKHPRSSCIGLLLGLLLSWRALAEPPPTPEPLTNLPWVKGVPVNHQEIAYKHFRQGNLDLKDSNFIHAAEEYREALKLWDHPAIHYNLSLALMRLDQPLEVYAQLEAAMLYGPAPLEKERYEYARTYKTLLDQQLVLLSLSCQKEGATVTVDGSTAFTAPGHYEARIRPGAHIINAIKDGYLPSDRSRTLMPGEKVDLEIKLYTEEDVTRTRRRWAAWMPWVVTGGGLALAAGGGLLQLRTQDSYRAFDAAISQCGGCKIEPDVAKDRVMGDRLRLASWGAYAVGGGALVTGAVLLYLNRSQVYRIDPETGRDAVSLAPLVGATNGLQASGSF